MPRYDLSAQKRGGMKFAWVSYRGIDGTINSYIFVRYPYGKKSYGEILGFVEMVSSKNRKHGKWLATFPTEYADVFDHKYTKTLTDAKIFVERHYNLSITKKRKTDSIPRYAMIKF